MLYSVMQPDNNRPCIKAWRDLPSRIITSSLPFEPAKNRTISACRLAFSALSQLLPTSSCPSSSPICATSVASTTSTRTAATVCPCPSSSSYARTRAASSAPRILLAASPRPAPKRAGSTSNTPNSMLPTLPACARVAPVGAEGSAAAQHAATHP